MLSLTDLDITAHTLAVRRCCIEPDSILQVLNR